METLSIIAYKQPITRGEIEEIRGVEVSAVVDTLMDRKLLRIVGRKETLGRPILFGTTPEFLRIFGLKRLEDLPPVDTLVAPSDLISEEAPLIANSQEGESSESLDGAEITAEIDETLERVTEPVLAQATEHQMEIEPLESKEGQETL